MAWGKQHKYSATRVVIDGESFPSKLEGSVYQILKLRERAGEIRDIRRQSSVVVKSKCHECGDGPVVWKVDFSFEDVKTGARVYCEAKGAETSDYTKRKKLWKASPPGRLEVWKGSWRNPALVEVIE